MRTGIVIAWLLGAVAPATADVSPADAAKATALFESGHTAIEAGRLDEACDSFAASLALDPQLGTRLNLADCRERQGRLIEAFAMFTQTADEATLAGKEGRASFARDRAKQLRARLVRVTLRVAEPELAGLAIAMTTPSGSQELPPTTWGQPQFAEAGSIVIVVSAPGRESRRIERGAIGGNDIVIDVPAPAAAVVVHALPGPTGGREHSIVPYVVGGAGGGLWIGSLLLGLHGRSIYQDALKTGGPDIDHQISRAERWADVGTGFAIAGTLAASAGIYLFIHDRREPIIVAPSADAHGASVVISGQL